MSKTFLDKTVELVADLSVYLGILSDIRGYGPENGLLGLAALLSAGLLTYSEALGDGDIEENGIAKSKELLEIVRANMQTKGGLTRREVLEWLFAFANCLESGLKVLFEKTFEGSGE